MKFLVEWFARHSLAANLLVLTTLVGAWLAANNLPREILPRTEADQITVTALLPGASPATIEASLCTPMEETLKPLPAIGLIQSTSTSNQCSINIRLKTSSDSTAAMREITAALGRLSLPPQAGKPVITSTLREPIVVRLGVAGPAAYATLLDTAGNIAADLQALGLSKVRVIEAKQPHYAVEIPLARLLEYQTSLAEIAHALQVDASHLPAGHISSGQTLATVVVNSRAGTSGNLADTVIRSLPDGTQLRLGDIASIRKAFSGPEGRINGEASVAIAIYQGSNHSISDISSIVENYVKAKQVALPANVKLLTVFDNARFFNARMDYLQSNFFSGLLISSLILFIWLRLRLAFWITADIPIAFGGGLIWLYLMGGSLNVVSAFGLIVVLGIVCDDAIVIGENIHRHQHAGKPGLAGAIAGVREMANTVIFAVSTTVLMFIPLLFVPGSEGDLMRPLPMIVIAILIASLIEALLVLPTHLARHKPAVTLPSPGLPIADRLDRLVLHAYRPALAAALQWRYGILSACSALFLLSISLILSGHVRVDFFSAVETEIATGAVTFPYGTSQAATLAAVRTMETSALKLKQELQREFGSDQITLVRSFVAEKSPHGEVYLSLATSAERRLASAEIMRRWQEKTGPVAGATGLSFTASVKVDTADMTLLLKGNDNDILARASQALRQQLQAYAGVTQVQDSYSTAHSEIRLQLRPEASSLGLNQQVLSTQLHMALEGVQLPDIQGYPVRLQLPERERRSATLLQELPVQAGLPVSVPLAAVAAASLATSPASILHHDGQRASLVTARLDTGVMNPAQLMQQLQKDFFPRLQQEFPGIHWSKTGAMESETRIKRYLTVSFMLSLLAMFIMLAVSLNSLYQPLMIFSAIPFGIIGALLGHLLTGQPLTLWSLAGMIAVSGIVVNNNMVIIFFINERLKAGENLKETVMAAGARRFRPIMLTTVTTFVGVLPTILNNSWEAQFLIPLAISIGFGVLFAAILTLFLVPCLYLIGNDLYQHQWRKSLVAKAQEDPGAG